LKKEKTARSFDKDYNERCYSPMIQEKSDYIENWLYREGEDILAGELVTPGSRIKMIMSLPVLRRNMIAVFTSLFCPWADLAGVHGSLTIFSSPLHCPGLHLSKYMLMGP
jgi:hypothetical protein